MLCQVVGMYEKEAIEIGCHIDSLSLHFSVQLLEMVDKSINLCKYTRAGFYGSVRTENKAQWPHPSSGRLGVIELLFMRRKP